MTLLHLKSVVSNAVVERGDGEGGIVLLLDDAAPLAALSGGDDELAYVFANAPRFVKGWEEAGGAEEGGGGDGTSTAFASWCGPPGSWATRSRTPTS